MIKKFILLIVCFIGVLGWSQNIKFQNFETNYGLSNNSVLDIENDKDGGLWIATWDGLNYYDGYTFTVFKHDIDNSNSIAGNYITKIIKDASNNIWILTKDAKISRYTGNKQFKNYTFNKNSKDIFKSKKGNIVVATTDSYYEFINGQFQKSDKSSILIKDLKPLKNILLDKYPNIIINDILKDKTGNIWCATRKNGLFVIINNLKSINDHQIEQYTQDPYSIYSFNSNEIETLNEDVFGNIWLGLKDGGISMAYTNSDKIFSIAPHPQKFPNIPNETLRAITKDLKGKIWLGYYTKGLYYYNSTTKTYNKFKIKESIEKPDWDRVRSLFSASDGTVWVGTYAGVINIKKNGNYFLYNAETISELPNNRNYDFYEDNNKQLWIACWGGVAKFNLKTNKFETFKGQKLVSNYHIRSIKTIDNELIIGTENNGIKLLNLVKGELQSLKVQKILSLYHKNEKPLNDIGNNKSNKLIDIKNGELQTINTNEGLLSNSVYSIYKDKQTNYYWIATLGGISVYDKKKGVVKNISEKEGLPSQLVYGLLVHKNNIWASTTKGIAVIDKKSFQVKVFYPNGGWQTSEFSEGAYYKDPKGMLFFGGINGVSYFNPSNIEFDNFKPKIKLLVDGKENYASFIEKRFRNNRLEIVLTPISFPKENIKNIYYKLEGKDKDWNLLSTQKKVNYNNLVSGNYRFLIKEKENSSTVFFSLNIKKVFYKTISFYVLLSIFILITVVILIYLKNRTTFVQKKKLEDLILARTQVIENQKKDLVVVNSKLDEKNKEILLQKEKLLKLHNNLKNEDFEVEKFKTFVLSEFQEPISKIIKTSSTLKENSEAQQNLIQQSSKLVNLISEWNYLNNIKDIGPVKISVVNLFPVLKNSIEKLKKALQTNKVNFNCVIDTTVDWVETDILRFRLLLQYFFNDISKYSDSESNVHIKIDHNKNFLTVKLRSNSTTLKSNWDSIFHYSPYFKALEVLLFDLNGTFVNDNILNKEFKVAIKLPLEVINPELKLSETISWKHFNQKDDLDASKKNILIFSEEENYATANQILEHQNYNLIFENSVSNLTSAIKQIHIDIIVFYQAIFSKELLHFLTDINTEESNKKKTPMIYISEDISYQLQEQSIEFGIDTLIQLPASESFITKKITSLITKKFIAIEDHKFQEKIFNILTDKEAITTSNDKLLKRSLETIKKELHNPSFNVEMLVEILGISRIKCYRLFKETLKQSPSDIITSLRLQKAEALLKNKKLNISEISFECGYNDPKYFARSFKKYFGKSPKEFKEQYY
jgi:ligand-binding sensor domain-containing protein/AraC-like DNA-binding protein